MGSAGRLAVGFQQLGHLLRGGKSQASLSASSGCLKETFDRLFHTLKHEADARRVFAPEPKQHGTALQVLRYILSEGKQKSQMQGRLWGLDGSTPRSPASIPSTGRTYSSSIQAAFAAQVFRNGVNVTVKSQRPSAQLGQTSLTRQFATESWTNKLRLRANQLFQGSKNTEKATNVVKPKRTSLRTPAATPKVYQQVSELAKAPLASLSNVASTYRQAAGLQVEAFWRRNYLGLVGAVGVIFVILLWRVLFGFASFFIGFSEGMAKYGFLALSASLVTFAGLYVRARYNINPDSVYRQTMRLLNADAGVLEVMGAPLNGSEVRAYVMSGGGIRFRNFRLRLSSRRCFLLFPIRGSERRGLVSAEVKKKQGKFNFKLLAVDVPTAGTSLQEQRIFVRGNQEVYDSTGGVMFELRHPILHAMAKDKDFEEEDEREEEEELQEKRAALAEAERQLQEEAERQLQEEAVRKLEETRKIN